MPRLGGASFNIKMHPTTTADSSHRIWASIFVPQQHQKSLMLLRPVI